IGKRRDHDIFKKRHFLKNLGRLEYPCDPELRDFMRRPPGQRLAGEGDAACIGLEATDTDIKKRRFPRPVRADNGMGCPFLDTHIDVGKRAAAAKPFVDIFQIEYVVSHRASSYAPAWLCTWTDCCSDFSLLVVK